MRILVVCDEGNNRSVTIAHQLKYWSHDVLTAGLNRNSPNTLDMLCEWADRIILTQESQQHAVKFAEELGYAAKMQLWDVGPDVYPRPFNALLLSKVRTLMAAHEEEYKP